MRIAFLSALIFVSTGIACADATLQLAPARATVSIGEPFEVAVTARTDGTAITAGEAELSFDPEEFSVQSVITDGSILSSWSTEPIFSNTIGYVRFSGWTGAPFKGDNGTLVRIMLIPRRNGVSELQFVSGALLSSESYGSNIVASMRSGVYTVEPREEVVESDTTAPQVLGERIETIPPTITSYPDEVRVGERIVIEGKALSDAHLSFSHAYNEKNFVSTIRAAVDGSFTYVSAPVTEAGTYRIWVSDEYGEKSDTLLVEVRDRGARSVAAAISSTVSFSWPAAAALVFVVLLALYFRRLANRALVRPDAGKDDR